MLMLIITSILSVLITINFLLLRFSCNKTTKQSLVVKKNRVRIIPSSSVVNAQEVELAPTGS